MNPCLPDRSQLNKWLGMDQVIDSAIENEKNTVSLICDIAGCWADICTRTFINDAVIKHLVFKAKFLHTVEHGAASAKIKRS